MPPGTAHEPPAPPPPPPVPVASAPLAATTDVSTASDVGARARRIDAAIEVDVLDGEEDQRAQSGRTYDGARADMEVPAGEHPDIGDRRLAGIGAGSVEIELGSSTSGTSVRTQTLRRTPRQNC